MDDHAELAALRDASSSLNLMDYPMHFFAAIQRKNYGNIQSLLAAHQLTPTEWRMLAFLFERGALGINGLSEITVTERSKTSRHIDALHKRGLVMRETGTRDLRSASVSLTEAGTEKYTQVLPILKQIYAANLEGIDQQEFDLLMTLIKKIKDNVSRIESFAGIRG